MNRTEFFYSNEHEPVHVHAQYENYESKIELIIEKVQLKKLLITEVPRRKPLPKKQLRDFKNLVEKLSDEIIQSWINYFVYHKKIVSKKIQGKI